MKKLLVIVLALMLVLSFAACSGNDDSAPSDSGGGESGASQPETDGQNEISIVNAAEEAWFSSTTNIAYVFFADGKYESYTLQDGIWDTNGNGTYKMEADSLTIDTTTYSASVKDDTLTFTVNGEDYAYVKTSPFNPSQSQESSLDEALVLPDGQAWIWEKNGVISGYVFKADGTYSYHAGDEWTLQSSGIWSTSGDTLELDNQSVRTYVLNSDGLTLTDFFDDEYGPYAALAIPSAN